VHFSTEKYRASFPNVLGIPGHCIPMMCGASFRERYVGEAAIASKGVVALRYRKLFATETIQVSDATWDCCRLG
jgi:hypothetical protein